MAVLPGRVRLAVLFLLTILAILAILLLTLGVVEYMHRVGRTARAGRSAHAITPVNRDSAAEQALIAEVQRCESGDWKFV